MHTFAGLVWWKKEGSAQHRCRYPHVGIPTPTHTHTHTEAQAQAHTHAQPQPHTNTVLTNALIALLAQTPHKLGAMATEGGLLEELGLELVVHHFVNLLLPHGTATAEVELFLRHGDLVCCFLPNARTRRVFA